MDKNIVHIIMKMCVVDHHITGINLKTANDLTASDLRKHFTYVAVIHAHIAVYFERKGIVPRSNRCIGKVEHTTAFDLDTKFGIGRAIKKKCDIMQDQFAG
jgi:hypothetical protein